MPLSEAFQPSSSAMGMTAQMLDSQRAQRMSRALMPVSDLPATDMLTLSRLHSINAMACTNGTQASATGMRRRPASSAVLTMAQVTFHLCGMPLPGGLGPPLAGCPLASGMSVASSTKLLVAIGVTAAMAGKELNSSGPLGGGSSWNSSCSSPGRVKSALPADPAACRAVPG